MTLERDPVVDTAASLRVFAEQHASRQWRGFIGSLVTELETQIDLSDLVMLLRRVGIRMAKATPLPACSTLDELQAVINDIWASMDWGVMEIREGEKLLTIVHIAYPHISAGVAATADWVVPVLEGVYTEWLNSQSGDMAFKARRSAATTAGSHAIEFVYGLLAE
ncbi:MAG TPA: cellulose biosynthesis protein BcsD [Stellaceae bacterium]|nr:cellulose biosynthesis protein BcsD [Stellaceae bacterium]